MRLESGATFVAVMALSALLAACSEQSRGPADAGGDGGTNDAGWDGGPTTLSSYGANGIALTETSVFFVNLEVGILSVPRNGGTTSIVYQKASAIESPAEIAVDEQSAYWTDFAGNRVMKIDLASGVITVLDTPSEPLGLKLRNGILYWASQAGLVGFVSVDGFTKGTYDVGAGSMPAELDVDDSAIYVTDLSGPTGPNQKIERVDLDSGVVNVLTSNENDPGMIVVDDLYVYWGVGDDSGGELHSVAKMGGTVSTLASSPLAIVGVGLDAGSIYFTSFAHSEATVPQEGLYQLDRLTGITSNLASGLYYPRQLIVGSDGIYWGEEGLRVAKLPLAP